MNPQKTKIHNLCKELLSGRIQSEFYSLNQFSHLANAVAAELRKEDILERNPNTNPMTFSTLRDCELSSDKKDIFREVFWDLFRDGKITLGCDSANPDFPFFKVHSEANFD